MIPNFQVYLADGHTAKRFYGSSRNRVGRTRYYRDVNVLVNVLVNVNVPETQTSSFSGTFTFTSTSTFTWLFQK
jgi:hypothetical protein